MKKRKKHSRSKTSMLSQQNSGRNSYGHSQSNSRLSSIVPQPVDWLQERRKRRAEKGDNFNYAHSEFWKQYLPKQLSHEYVSSYHEVKHKAKMIEKKAQQIETNVLSINASKNLVKDTFKVGSM